MRFLVPIGHVIFRSTIMSHCYHVFRLHLARVERQCVSRPYLCLMDPEGPDRDNFGVLHSGLHTLSSDSSDSFTTSAEFMCPTCGVVVDVRLRTCFSCSSPLTFHEFRDAHEQDLFTPSVSSVDTIVDSSQTGSIALDVSADSIEPAELDIVSSGF